MTRTDVEQLALELLDAWQREDFDALAACCVPDVEIRIAGDASKVPFGGTYRGIRAMADLAQSFLNIVESVGFVLDDLVVDGERVVVRWSGSFRQR